MFSLSVRLMLVQLLWLVASVFCAGFYDSPTSPVKELTAGTFKKHVLESDTLSIVEFYAPWCGHCKNLKPEYIKAAKNLKNLVNVAAINCDEAQNKNTCAQYQIKGFPTIKVFRPPKLSQEAISSARESVGNNTSSESTRSAHKRPIIEDYTGERVSAAIVTNALSRLPNYVTSLTDSEALHRFISKEPVSTSKVVMLSARKAPNQPSGIPALYKALAAEFIHAPFGYVPPVKSSQSLYEELIPEIIRADDGLLDKSVLLVFNSGDDSPLVYHGKMNHESTQNFLQEHVAGTVIKHTDASKPQLKKSEPKSESKKSAVDVKTVRNIDEIKQVCFDQTKPCIIVTTVKANGMLESTNNSIFAAGTDAFVFVYVDTKVETGNKVAEDLKLHPHGELFGYVSPGEGWISSTDQLSVLGRISSKAKKPRNARALGADYHSATSSSTNEEAHLSKDEL